MKTVILTILALTTATSAKADGFKCEGVNTGVLVKVYNHIMPSDGTRSAAIMVVSDSNVGSPNKTIAKFTDENKTLAYLGGGVFKAKVDLRYHESNHKGENIGGTKLGELKNILLEIKNFTYPTSSAANAATLDAHLSYVKRNGEILEEKAICERYLKN